MKGLFIGKGKDSYIEQVKQKSATLSLIAHGDETEVMIQEIKANKTFGIGPAEILDTMEFFYILEGAVLYTENGEQKRVNKGDYFYVQHLSDIVTFQTLEPSRILYMSTKPVFHHISEVVKELTEIVRRVEEKDTYTHKHGNRVEDLSVKIARKLGFKGDSLLNLGYSALFHDIGKINVPDKVLKKAGKLTDKEYNLVKKHPLDGANMVVGTFFDDIKDIILQHHERCDGSGYPYGLTADQICLEAKIIAITDSFDAMISDRPYRQGMSVEQAIAELLSLSPKLHDQELVMIFKEIIENEQSNN